MSWNRQLQGLADSKYRFEFRWSFGAERSVQTLLWETCLLCELNHSFSLRHFAKCPSNEWSISQIFFNTALEKSFGIVFRIDKVVLDVKFFAKLRSHALYSSSKFLVETFSESLNERRLTWLNSAASYTATDSSCWVLHCINRWIWDLKLSNGLTGFSS
mgnify:FL=1